LIIIVLNAVEQGLRRMVLLVYIFFIVHVGSAIRFYLEIEVKPFHEKEVAKKTTSNPTP